MFSLKQNKQNFNTGWDWCRYCGGAGGRPHRHGVPAGQQARESQTKWVPNQYIVLNLHQTSECANFFSFHCTVELENWVRIFQSNVLGRKIL